MAFCEFYYHSAALALQSSAWILVPDGEGPFSVLYLLHGWSDDHTIWCRRTALERYADRHPKLMIVMPFGAHSFYCDAPDGPAYESSLVKDLIPRIDRTFHTRRERAGRGTGGLSMGGYGALKLALKFPELFGSAHSHSGAVAFGHGWRDAARDPDVRAILGDAIGGGGPNDLYRLATECPRLPALRIDCGTSDFLIEPNRAFHAHLKASNVPHDYLEFPGAHNWEYWDTHIPAALEFHARAMGIAS